MATVLITGASGLIGTALTRHLLAQGAVVRHLGRTRSDQSGVPSYAWDLSRGAIDPEALTGVTHIVHLAGAGIADRCWSPARVRVLIESRTETARLLHRGIQARKIPLQAFVSAAGVGYYGAVTAPHIFEEDDQAGGDTIATISERWESAVDEWQGTTRVVKLRTPVVLAREGGALPKLAAPMRFGMGAALGHGRQWMPWVHLDDLVRLYTTALFDERYTGAYNVNTGNDVTNAEMMRAMAQVMGKPYFMPRIPAFVLRWALGELSTVLLEGSRASNEKLLHNGFTFKFATIRSALGDLLG
jgi:hypothetical protein